MCEYNVLILHTVSCPTSILSTLQTNNSVFQQYALPYKQIIQYFNNATPLSVFLSLPFLSVEYCCLSFGQVYSYGWFFSRLPKRNLHHGCWYIVIKCYCKIHSYNTLLVFIHGLLAPIYPALCHPRTPHKQSWQKQIGRASCGERV